MESDERATPSVSIAYACALIGVVGGVWISVYKRTASGDAATQFTASVIGYALVIALVGYGVCWITKTRSRAPYVIATGCCVLFMGWGTFATNGAAQTSESSPNHQYVAGTSMPPLPAGFTLDSTNASAPAPTVQPSSDGGAQTWKRDATAFQQAHPELAFGHNLQVLQAHLNHLNIGTMTNKEMLETAYAQAVRDNQWSQTP